MEYVLIGILCAVFAAIIAHAKGRSAVGWGCLGLCVGVFALVVAVLPSKDQAQQRAALVYGTRVGNFRICPSCAEPIRVTAHLCRFCQSAV